MELETIRSLVRNDRTEHGYSQEVHQAVGDYARRLRAEGARWCDIAAEVGVSAASARSHFVTGLEEFEAKAWNSRLIQARATVSMA